MGRAHHATKLDKRRGAEILVGRSDESRDRSETHLVAASNVAGVAGALAGYDSDFVCNEGRVADGQQRSCEAGFASVRQKVSK